MLLRLDGYWLHKKRIWKKESLILVNNSMILSKKLTKVTREKNWRNFCPTQQIIKVLEVLWEHALVMLLDHIVNLTQMLMKKP